MAFDTSLTVDIEHYAELSAFKDIRDPLINWLDECCPGEYNTSLYIDPSTFMPMIRVRLHSVKDAIGFALKWKCI